MTAWGLVAWALAAAPCPDDARIAEALSRSTPHEVRARHRWSVAVLADSMKLTLLNIEGSIVRERTVPSPEACSERETVAAAVLAAWMVATPAAREPPVVAPVVKPAPPVPVAAASPPPPARESPTPPIPARVTPPPEPPPPEEALKPAPEEEVSPPPLPAVLLAPPLPASTPSSLRLEAALDGRAQLAGTLAAGLGVTLSVGDRLGGFLEVSSALSRALVLPPGQVRWVRFALGLGVRYRFDLSQLYFEPALSVEGAWMRFEGQGYQKNEVATGLDFSACAQLRAGRFFTPAFGLYLGARGCAWPLQNKVGVTSVPDTASLPTFEVAALLGTTFGVTVKGSEPSRPSEK